MIDGSGITLSGLLLIEDPILGRRFYAVFALRRLGQRIEFEDASGLPHVSFLSKSASQSLLRIPSVCRPFSPVKKKNSIILDVFGAELAAECYIP